MSPQPEQARQDIEELLERVDDLLAEAKADYYDIEDLGDDLQAMFERNAVSRFHYDLQCEELKRSYEHSGEHVKHLERQRKLLLYHLSQFDK